MTVVKTNILWKSFKGLRSLNSINSTEELGADLAMNVTLSKEKSGQFRSIRSSGWFNPYKVMGEKVIRLFSANMSGVANEPNQLLAFTKTDTNINVYVIETDTGVFDAPLKIGVFNSADDVTDVKMVQFGDRMVVAIAFNKSYLGFVAHAGDVASLKGWTSAPGGQGYWYRDVNVTTTTLRSVDKISTICAYGSRLAINGEGVYSGESAEFAEKVYGVWFSAAGNPTSFTDDYITSAQDTSAFFVETGEYVNKLVEYNGLVAGCRNHFVNISGTKVSDYRVEPLTEKGLFGNAMFVINGSCAYVDNYANNIFIMKNNIDGTIGFDSPIGDDIQSYVSDMEDVSINAIGRKVRVTKKTGISLIYDVDIAEWVTNKFNPGSRVVTFLGKEIMCDGSTTINQITETRQASSQQLPDDDGYYSHYRTNLMWLDSQTSIKSHIYPFAVVLEPQTNNDFIVKFTVDRKKTYEARVVRAGYENIATYSQTDEPPADGTHFVDSDDDLSGRVFFTSSGGDFLVTVQAPPFWRYLQIDVYTNEPGMEFNITGIEAKQTFIDDEQLDY